MKVIKLTQNKYTLVDESDFVVLSKYKWYYSEGYAVRMPHVSEGRTPKNRNVIRMHRFIMVTKKGYETDHINGDKLDNRRQNLRICLKAENHRNRKIQSNNTSGFKGVSFRKDLGLWATHLGFEGKTLSLGHFKSKKLAAIAYNTAAMKHHGEFAKLNLI